MLSPARGPSFRGLEHSQIAFFSNHFRELSSCCSGTLVFQIFKQNAGPNGTPKWLKNEVKNRVKKLRFPGSPKISHWGKVEGDLGPFWASIDQRTDRRSNRPQTIDHRPVRPNRPQTTDRLQQTSPDFHSRVPLTSRGRRIFWRKQRMNYDPFSKDLSSWSGPGLISKGCVF